MIRSGPTVLAGAVLVLLTACSPRSGASVAPAATGSAPGAATADLTIDGAASLKGVLDRAKAAYEAGHPGTSLTISTDSSAALETQIEQGAPADVFLSADTTNPQKLADAGLTAGPAVAFAGNELALIVPAANPAGVATPFDLAKARVKYVAAGDQVPITKYAAQLIANLAASPGAPPGFAARVAANTVSKEDNVKAVVAKIELGEGDAGIVYVTDARASTKVRTVAIDPTVNVWATYAGVVVRSSTNVAAAEAFLAWFAGPDGRAILASFGFLPPS